MGEVVMCFDLSYLHKPIGEEGEGDRAQLLVGGTQVFYVLSHIGLKTENPFVIMGEEKVEDPNSPRDPLARAIVMYGYYQKSILLKVKADGSGNQSYGNSALDTLYDKAIQMALPAIIDSRSLDRGYFDHNNTIYQIAQVTAMLLTTIMVAHHNQTTLLLVQNVKDLIILINRIMHFIIKDGNMGHNGYFLKYDSNKKMRPLFREDMSHAIGIAAKIEKYVSTSMEQYVLKKEALFGNNLGLGISYREIFQQLLELGKNQGGVLGVILKYVEEKMSVDSHGGVDSTSFNDAQITHFIDGNDFGNFWESKDLLALAADGASSFLDMDDRVDHGSSMNDIGNSNIGEKPVVELGAVESDDEI